jgi:hypothetical protein
MDASVHGSSPRGHARQRCAGCRVSDSPLVDGCLALKPPVRFDGLPVSLCVTRLWRVNSTFNHQHRLQRRDRQCCGTACCSGARSSSWCRSGPRLHDHPLPPRQGSARAEADPRQHALEITWTVIPDRDPGVHRDPDGAHDLQHAGAGAARRAQVEGDRATSGGGSSATRVRLLDGERAVPADGRTVSAHAGDKDVLHSFWIPQMGGKRDLITNKTNYLWFTPNDDLPTRCGTASAPSTAGRRTRT